MGSPVPHLERQQFIEGMNRHRSWLRSSASTTTADRDDQDRDDQDRDDQDRDDQGRDDQDRDDQVFEVLYRHYCELVRWNPKLSLIGPGTAREVLDRHYGESLAGLPWILSARGVGVSGTEGRESGRQGGPIQVVDLGSGGGFPGLVLAAAAPQVSMTMVEAREKKWAFLKTSIRRCGLSSRCLNARVEGSLPSELPDRIDVVTCRAVALPARFFEAILDHSAAVKFVLWQGETPLDLPSRARVVGEAPLAGSLHRRIVEVRAV